MLEQNLVCRKICEILLDKYRLYAAAPRHLECFAGVRVLRNIANDNVEARFGKRADDAAPNSARARQ